MTDNSLWDTDPTENVDIDGWPVDDGLSPSPALVRAVQAVMASMAPGAGVTFDTVTGTTKGTFGGVDIWNGTQGSTGSVFVGTNAPAETGGDNIAIGFTAGRDITSGSDNTIMGRASAVGLTTGSNNLILGHDATQSSASVSNEITLGDANVTAFRIPGLSSTSMGATAWDAAVSATASYTTAEETKLAGVETGATADQTGAEIKTAYEAEANTNAFTDADHTKLDGIETAADVTDTTNVTAAGALMDSELTDIASVKALDQGVATTDTPTFNGAVVGDTAGEPHFVGRGGSHPSGTPTNVGATEMLVTGGLSGNTYVASQGNNNQEGIVFGRYTAGSPGTFTEKMRLDAINNRLGIGTATPTEALDVNGNIVVSGTVDGRDVATDGTKLDNLTVPTETAWVPTVHDAVTGGNAGSLTVVRCRYNDDGYVVRFSGQLRNITQGSMTAGNDIHFTLPSTVGAGSLMLGQVMVSGPTVSGSTVNLTIFADQNQSRFRVYETQSGAGVDALLVSEVANGTNDIWVSGWYFK